jgi:hypothetical protein
MKSHVADEQATKVTLSLARGEPNREQIAPAVLADHDRNLCNMLCENSVA